MAHSSDYTKCGVNFWEQRTRSRLTAEDVHQFSRNLVGFILVLNEWQNAEQNPDADGKDFIRECAVE